MQRLVFSTENYDNENQTYILYKFQLDILKKPQTFANIKILNYDKK